MQREKLHGRCQYLFIETICNDEETLERNYRNKVRLCAPLTYYIGTDSSVCALTELFIYFNHLALV